MCYGSEGEDVTSPPRWGWMYVRKLVSAGFLLPMRGWWTNTFVLKWSGDQ